jgi:hypothetical protein
MSARARQRWNTVAPVPIAKMPAPPGAVQAVSAALGYQLGRRRGANGAKLGGSFGNGAHSWFGI